MITALGLKRRFPEEYDAWEQGKMEIEGRFQRNSAERKAEMRAKIEEDPEGIKSKIQRGVVSEVLKTFP